MFQKTQKSQTLLINEQSRLLQSHGKKIYKFGFGQSPFMPPKRAMDALAQSVHRKDYTAVQGLPELRENIASFHSHFDGYDIQPHQIFVGTGSKILIFNTLLTFQSAVVLLPAPSWVSYKPQVDLARHQSHFVQTNYENRWRIQPTDLDAILSKPEYQSLSKILILNYPGNPEGLTYTPAELEEIASILRKHEAWVISDEIYSLLHHEGQHVSIARLYPERTITTTGLSKWCGAGGWRLGVQILPKETPKEMVDTILGIASETFSCAPTPIQVAACEAYQVDSLTENYLQNQRQVLRIIGNHIQSQLSECGIAVHPPEGGFYLLLDFSPLRDQLKAKGIETDTDLCLALLNDTGVAVLPGVAFGNDAHNLTTRLSYVDFDGQAIMDDVEKNPDNFANILDSHCSHILEGIQALVDWLS